MANGKEADWMHELFVRRGINCKFCGVLSKTDRYTWSFPHEIDGTIQGTDRLLERFHPSGRRFPSVDPTYDFVGIRTLTDVLFYVCRDCWKGHVNALHKDRNAE